MTGDAATKPARHLHSRPLLAPSVAALLLWMVVPLAMTLTKDVLTDFGYTIRTEEVDLSNQNIGDIDINAFEEYEELTKINLSSNQLEMVQLGSFAQNSKLTDLILANNKLRAFSAGVLAGAVSLENLHLSGNPL